MVIKMSKIDLHLHTNLSDGLLSPEDVISKAKNNGCKIISITDHDLFNEYNDFSNKYDIDIISGIEFNTSISNLHLLGYSAKESKLVNETMQELRVENEIICLEVIELLKRDGFDVSVEKIKEYLKDIKLDYSILDKRKLVKYLMYKGYSDSIYGTYATLLGRNQKYYIPNAKLTPRKIIDMIEKAGGYTVLAHPNTVTNDKDEFVKILKILKFEGLFGIEVVNDKMKLNETGYYQSLAKEYGLLETYGSDFHNPDTDQIGIEIDQNNYEKIHESLVLKRKM
jgi:Predicted metal-dependent phosphoesterases (PHP family)